MEEEKKERKLPMVTIFFCLLAILIGGLLAAHFLGLVNVAPLVADVPYVNQWIRDPYGGDVFTEEAPTPTPTPEPSPTANPLEEQNRELERKIAELEQDKLDQAAAYEQEKTEALRENTELRARVLELENYRAGAEAQAASDASMAGILQGMKPDAIVQIMDNWDDSTVVGALALLSDTQVGKVLALMDPERAAVITRMLMGQAG
jgi:flagellar motility protein MotE (MotC chaperone)